MKKIISIAIVGIVLFVFGITAYAGNGNSIDQYAVIDPLYSAAFPTTFAEFKTRFPNNASNWLTYDNPMCTFK